MPWFSLYCHVLDQSLAHGMKSKEATKGKRSATVLIEAEYTCLLEAMERLHQWMGKLMYGSGLSLMECIRLHVKDVDCGQGQLFIRDGKGEGKIVSPFYFGKFIYHWRDRFKKCGCCITKTWLMDLARSICR